MEALTLIPPELGTRTLDKVQEQEQWQVWLVDGEGY